MARLNIPPTKANLQKMSKTHKIASEGYHLLEQKREILVIELMSFLERVKRVEKELFIKTESAYESLGKSFEFLGHESIMRSTDFIHYDYPMKKKTNKIVGITMPSVEVEIPRLNLQYSFLNTNSLIDETTKKFLDLMHVVCEMAEIRAIVWRLSQEVKKVQRRVNALDKVVIPDSGDTIKYIEETLEEKDRQNLFLSKLVKKKLEEKS